jgi:lysophospholipase L1-like esterase
MTDRPLTIVCLGDSLTGCRPGEPYRHLYLKWTDLLEFALEARMGHRRARVLNAGHAGDCTRAHGDCPGALARLRMQVLDAHPDMALVLLGGNNMAPEAPETLREAVRPDLVRIGRELLEAGIRPAFLLYPPAQAADETRVWRHLEKANPAIAAAAAELGIPCLDLGPAFREVAASGVALDELRDPVDGVHLRPVGELVLARAALDLVSNLS